MITSATILRGIGGAPAFVGRDRQRRLKAEDVGVSTTDADQDAAFAQGRANFLRLRRGRFFGVAVTNEFQAEHQAAAADVADQPAFVLNLAESSHELLAALGGVLDQFFFLDDGDVSEGRRAGDWVAAEGGQVVARFHRVGNAFTGRQSAERKAAGDALGHR